MRRSASITLAAALALLAVAPAAGAQSAAPSPQRQVAKAFAELARDVRTLPRKSIRRRHRAALTRSVSRARRQARTNPCRAARTLRSFSRRGVRRVRERRVRGRIPSGASRRGRLRADALQAQVAVMQLPRARRCGGGRRSTVSEVNRTVLASDARQLRMKVSLPPPTFAPRKVGATTYEQMFMEGLGETGDTGKPGVPQLTKFFGVPQGADVQVTVNSAQSYTVKGVNLFPAQPQPVDQAPAPPTPRPDQSVFMDKPFAIDPRTYRSDAPFPAAPVDAASLGTMRNLRVGGVDLAGAQYRPKSDTLKVFTSLDVTVRFGGANTGVFGNADDFGNRWETWFNRNYGRLIENYGAVVDHVRPEIPPYFFCGEEMLVVTSPELSGAAEVFRAAKAAQGYLTRVALTGTGPGRIGTTKEEIQSYIRSRVTNPSCMVNPSFVVLLGNTAAVPTFLVPCGVGGNVDECNIASDLPYSLDGVGSDLFADVMLGRIPATTNEQATDVVNKIIAYQSTPPAPAGDDFYRHATVTGYFEPTWHCVLDAGATGTPNCNPEAGAVNGHWEIDETVTRDQRGFTKTSDRILRAMRAQSYSVDRLWHAHDENRPEKYYDDSNIPDNLRKPAFAWDADTDDFLGAYNQGRFLILHRDHGWPDGWADPTLHSGHVPLMTNGTKLPVIFGVNCASAAFDNPAHPSFVELQVQRIGGGAVAAFGDTRNSPSFPNNHMARGFFDALFPALEPDFGSGTPTRRMGDVLLSGKAFMAAMEGVDWQTAGDTYVEHYLYHLLGDPSMQMWAAEPRGFDPSRIVTQYRERVPGRPGDPPWEIVVNFPIGGGDPPPEGTVMTLFNNGEAIGRAVMGPGGVGIISPETNVEPESLSVSFNQDGVLPAQDGVEGVPRKAPPPKPKEKTSLTLDQPPNEVASGSPQTFEGRIAPGFGGAKIRLVFTQTDNGCGPDDGATFTREATTNASGDYSVSHTFSPNQCGTWTVQAFFDGDDTHEPSESPKREFGTTD